MINLDVNLVDYVDSHQLHLKQYSLPQDALISDLKGSIVSGEGFKELSRVRVYFKTASGQNKGVEDDDKITEILKESGQFQARFSDLSRLNGTIRIDVEESSLGQVAILMGSRKSFEHYLLNQRQLTLPLPKGIFGIREELSLLSKVLSYRKSERNGERCVAI